MSGKRGHRPQPGPERARAGGRDRAGPARGGARGRPEDAPPGPRPRGVNTGFPAGVADRRLASVPAIMARKPRRARSCLRSGTSAPIPPICMPTELMLAKPHSANVAIVKETGSSAGFMGRSEEHTSELQSRLHLVCRLLLEKKKQLHT